ncbi:glycosyltransferase family 2 protein [Lentibacillus sp. N15]|uniref:glycosyltransferase family 2 protein n=1 Tax=Lentibacillus songyuanensis TaxID=3136161 RepID=UPI0031B9E977
MEDITAILLHYTDQSALDKALNSLKQLPTKIKMVYVFLENNIHLVNRYDDVQFITIHNQDLGEMLNHLIKHCSSTYLLFMQHTDYIAPGLSAETLKLPKEKMVIATWPHNRQIHQPFLVRISLFQGNPFVPIDQLPFKEAFLSAWLFTVDPKSITLERDLIKQGRENHTANNVEKQKIMRKYQQTISESSHPTISVMIANYNMGSFLEKTISSCVIQHDSPEQILIIDDGSTDDSMKRLEKWNNNQQISVFSKNNGGKAKALNELLPHVTTDFVLELDADDWLDPDAIGVIRKHIADLAANVSVLYGNLRKWKQQEGENVQFKRVLQGTPVNNWNQLRNYHFPLGPRVYRTSFLKKYGGYPVISFENGRLYEDISLLSKLIQKTQFCYRNFTVYNVREHKASITRKNRTKWNEFITLLDANENNQL